MKNKKSIYEFFKCLNLEEDYESLKEKFNYFLEKNSDIIRRDNKGKSKCVEVGEYIRDKEKTMLREKINKNSNVHYNIKEILNAKT